MDEECLNGQTNLSCLLHYYMQESTISTSDRVFQAEQQCFVNRSQRDSNPWHPHPVLIASWPTLTTQPVKKPLLDLSKAMRNNYGEVESREKVSRSQSQPPVRVFPLSLSLSQRLLGVSGYRRQKKIWLEEKDNFKFFSSERQTELKTKQQRCRFSIETWVILPKGTQPLRDLRSHSGHFFAVQSR